MVKTVNFVKSCNSDFIPVLLKPSKFILLLCFTVLSLWTLEGQFTESRIILPFRFKDGIYENFSQVLRNDPVPKANLLIAEDFADAEFYKRILKSCKIIYSTAEGSSKYIDTRKVWGFASDGILYVHWKGYYSPLYMLGTISCFFLHDWQFDIYRNIISMHYGHEEDMLADNRKLVVRYRDLKKYLLDFRTGKIMKLNVRNLSRLIKNDTELYSVYRWLPRARREAQIFLYIRNFNEKNPLSLLLK